MIKITTLTLFVLLLHPASMLSRASACVKQPGGDAWETMETKGAPIARHEAAFVEFEGEFYLLGGRRIQPVSIYNPETKEWREGAKPPMTVHHFQPVVYEDKILMICAMTRGFPKEVGLDRVLIYEPRIDAWSWGDPIPEERRRGSAGVALVDGKIYVVGGIVRGHLGGYVPWTDRYDPETGEWAVLPDAPHARDHFQCAVVEGKIYAAGGRRTSHETGELFDLVVPAVDVFDLETETWSVLPEDLPTPRAGNSTFSHACHVVVAGGESMAQGRAHDEVEAWHVHNKEWESWPAMNRGRHGTGHLVFENYIFTCSGSGGRGGGPELDSIERLRLQTQEN
ncbi:MAG: galactose oxidase [Verrucomicrobia bacterium]|jgi:hypothetical protein|nr:galactose oxidase [Verrucomicrobiota bacterium]